MEYISFIGFNVRKRWVVNGRVSQVAQQASGLGFNGSLVRFGFKNEPT